jgi:hypothetical protein
MYRVSHFHQHSQNLQVQNTTQLPCLITHNTIHTMPSHPPSATHSSHGADRSQSALSGYVDQVDTKVRELIPYNLIDPASSAPSRRHPLYLLAAKHCSGYNRELQSVGHENASRAAFVGSQGSTYVYPMTHEGKIPFSLTSRAPYPNPAHITSYTTHWSLDNYSNTCDGGASTISKSPEALSGPAQARPTHGQGVQDPSSDTRDFASRS